jgi:hypothetical protein
MALLLFFAATSLLESLSLAYRRLCSIKTAVDFLIDVFIRPTFCSIGLCGLKLILKKIIKDDYNIMMTRKT